METSFQLLAVVQPVEKVAFLRSTLDATRYEICTASLESMASEVNFPTSPVVSLETSVQFLAVV